MKKKMLLMMLALTVSVALIVGATMAWFTAEDETEDAEFTAGKVSISADGATPLGDRSLDNVNPGDCYTLEYEITNDGTKVINLRAILNINWDDDYLSCDNIIIIPHPSTNWVLYQLEEQEGPEHPIYAYYLGDESKDVDPGETVKLRLVVYFDGEETGIEYMEKKFYVKGEVEAVQVSHNAASNIWGEEGWDAVIGGEEFDYAGWYLVEELEFDPTTIDCYTHNFEEPEPDDPVLDSFTTSINVEHDVVKWIPTSPYTWGYWQRYTRITVTFSDARDQYGNAFTGEQKFNLRYRTKESMGDDEYTTKEITVNFNDGEGEYIKEVIPTNHAITVVTTTVTKID